MHICKFCGKSFKSGQSLGAHIIHCIKNPDNYIESHKQKRLDKNPIKTYEFICQICGKPYKLDLKEKTYIAGKYRKTCSRKCACQLTNYHTDLKLKNQKISDSLKGSSNPHYNCHKDESGQWIENTEDYNTGYCEICGNNFFNVHIAAF